jgi:hypothetical protein
MDNKNDNELIAEFMGYKQLSAITDLSGYYNEWNTLMPVVEKIAKIVTPENEIIHNGDESRFDSFYPRTFGMLNAETKQFMVRINRFPLYQADSLIGATHQAVVDFIKWYNEQNKEING